MGKVPRVRNTLFYEPPKYKYLGEIVSFENPEAAKGSVEQLWEEFNKAKTKDKKVRIWRATDLAWKRAVATLKRKNLSPKERKEYEEIARIYYDAAWRMHMKLFGR